MNTTLGRRANLANFYGSCAEQGSMRLVVIGDADDNVQVIGRPNYVYGRVGGVSGEKIEIHSAVIKPRAGDFVYAMPMNPNGNGGWRLVFWLRGRDPLGPPPIGTDSPTV